MARPDVVLLLKLVGHYRHAIGLEPTKMTTPVVFSTRSWIRETGGTRLLTIRTPNVDRLR